MRRVPAVSAIVVVVVLAVVLAVLSPGTVPAAGAQALDYRAPVAGPVVSPFARPAEPWLPGNRGVDFDPPPGTPVTAAADGVVVFAGSVGGTLHVTLRHDDGLRTSYSFLAEVLVSVGGRVRQGDPVGVAGGPIHFGVRDQSGQYLDPAQLLAGVLPARAVLVPGTDEGADPLSERQSLLATMVGSGLAATRWVASGLSALAELPVGVSVAALQAGLGLDRLGDCTAPSVAVPRPVGRRIAVVVSGLGTGSAGNSAWELPTSSLGYASTDVVRFSYTGGRAPDPAAPADASSGGLAGIEQHEFSARDSQQSLTASADRLEELIAEVAAREPGVPIDVLAHSQGGVVSRLALDGAARDGRLPGTVANLVTLGSPHGGAPLADGAVGLGTSLSGQALLDAGTALEPLKDLDPSSPAVRQLGEGSSELRSVADRPLPDGVRFTSIGARWDPVVPAGQTVDDAARAVVVDPSGLRGLLEAHGELTTSPQAVREVGLAIAGLPPTCESVGDHLLDWVASRGIGMGERGVSANLVALADPGPGLARAHLRSVGWRTGPA